jgi:hypothetical protein
MAFALAPHASPPPELADDGMSFENFCIVCDRLILPPKEVEQVKTVKKKQAAGTIRVSRVCVSCVHSAPRRAETSIRSRTPMGL